MTSSQILVKKSIEKLKAAGRIYYSTPEEYHQDIEDMRNITRNMEDAEREYRKRTRVSELCAARTLLSC